MMDPEMKKKWIPMPTKEEFMEVIYECARRLR
jgi:hypothetical protein